MISKNTLLFAALVLLISAVFTATAIGVLAILERESLPTTKTDTSQQLYTSIQNVEKNKAPAKPLKSVSTPLTEPKVEIRKQPSAFKIDRSTSGSPPKEQSVITAKVLSTDRERMQFLVDTRPEISSLPSDAAIKISFFEKQESYILLGRTIIPYTNQDFDLTVETGDYYLKDLIYDFCGTVNRVKSLQDYRWSLNKDRLSLLMKYAGALTQKNACG